MAAPMDSNVSFVKNFVLVSSVKSLYLLRNILDNIETTNASYIDDETCLAIYSLMLTLSDGIHDKSKSSSSPTTYLTSPSVLDGNVSVSDCGLKHTVDDVKTKYSEIESVCKRMLHIIRQKYITELSSSNMNVSYYGFDLAVRIAEICLSLLTLQEAVHTSREIIHECVNALKILYVIDPISESNFVLQIKSNNDSNNAENYQWHHLVKFFTFIRIVINSYLHVNDESIKCELEILKGLALCCVLTGIETDATRLMAIYVRPLSSNAENRFGEFELSIQRELYDRLNDCDVLGSRRLLVLCGLADLFFPMNLSDCTGIVEVWHKCLIWKTIQDGICSLDTIDRKRSLYVLKRIIDICGNNNVILENKDFWWKNDVLKQKSIWNGYILLLEMLEEKQVHVIKPLMPQLRQVIEAVQYSGKGQNSIVHINWLLALFKRISGHESMYIQRWGIQQVLSLDTRLGALMQQCQEFFSGQFLQMINENGFFYRFDDSQLSADCPVVASKLFTFMKQMHESFKGDHLNCALFWKKFLRGVRKVSWFGTVLLFVCQAISEISPTYLFDEDDLQCIRELIKVGALDAMDVKSRFSTKWFLTKSVINLVDPNVIKPAALVSYFTTVGSEVISRGSILWNDMVKWIVAIEKNEFKLWNQSELCSFLKTTIAALSTKPADIEPIIDGFTNFLLLCADADIVKVNDDEHHGMKLILQPVSDILMSAATRMYLCREKIDAMLHFLCLLNVNGNTKHISNDNQVSLHIRKIIAQCRKEVVDYILIRITHESTQLQDISKIHVYLQFVDALCCADPDQDLSELLMYTTESLIRILKDVKDQDKLEKKLSYILSTALLSKVCSLMKKIHSSIGIVVAKSVKDFWTLQMTTCCITKHDILNEYKGNVTAFSNDSHNWARLRSLFNVSQWICMECSIGSYDFDSDSDKVFEVYEACRNGLDAGSRAVITPIITCLKACQSKMLELNTTLVVEIWDVCWFRIIDERKSKDTFWLAFQLLIELVFETKVIKTALSKANLECKLKQFADRIFLMSEEKTGILNVMMNHWCKNWLTVFQSAPATLFMNYLVEAAKFGPIHKKNVRYQNDLHSYLQTFPAFAEVGETEIRISREDFLVRTMLITALINAKESHNEQLNEFMENFIFIIMKDVTSEIESKKFRGFTNSMAHRQKNRLVSILLVLECYVTKEKFLEHLHFYNKIMEREVQPSVRIIVEWIIIRIFHRLPELMAQMWMSFDLFPSKKPAYICSWMLIAFHVGQLISDRLEQENYLKKLLPLIFPQCVAHHFHIRVFAQVLLVKIWDLCKEKNLESILSGHSIIETMKTFMVQSTGNSSKNYIALTNNFCVVFHPQKDYTLETIFHTIPKLTGLNDDEWIDPEAFMQLTTDLDIDKSCIHIPFLEPLDSTIHTCHSVAWKMKHLDEEEIDVLEGNVQRKITPWQTMCPIEDCVQEIIQNRSKDTRSGLILVASLVDKIPNLGGLCRTCEVFGVSEFVVGSMKYLDDKNFQSLSVSSEKWINIKEVKKSMLKEYIEEMHHEGYSIVGVEQTAKSICLSEFCFPDKTLLLLGHEKEGIPVDIIQLLQFCVEIPQQGIIRSLNVHVSGAILLWEYTRQQVLKGKS